MLFQERDDGSAESRVEPVALVEFDEFYVHVVFLEESGDRAAFCDGEDPVFIAVDDENSEVVGELIRGAGIFLAVREEVAVDHDKPS